MHENQNCLCFRIELSEYCVTFSDVTIAFMQNDNGNTLLGSSSGNQLFGVSFVGLERAHGVQAIPILRFQRTRAQFQSFEVGLGVPVSSATEMRAELHNESTTSINKFN